MKRRRFLGGALAAAAAGASGCSRGAEPYRFFTAEEASTLDALCEQIIPTDQDPGARDAGVLEFIDRQIVRHLRRHKRAYRDGLQAVDSLSRGRHGKSYAGLSSGQQAALLPEIEKVQGAFFELVVSHALMGFYGSPRHGGNREGASWKMLGLPRAQVRGRLQDELTREPRQVSLPPARRPHNSSPGAAS